MGIDHYLIDKPSETELFHVRGDSMIDAGIHEGDFVVVEKTRSAMPGDVVLAFVDGRVHAQDIGARQEGLLSAGGQCGLRTDPPRAGSRNPRRDGRPVPQDRVAPHRPHPAAALMSGIPLTTLRPHGFPAPLRFRRSCRQASGSFVPATDRATARPAVLPPHAPARIADRVAPVPRRDHRSRAARSRTGGPLLARRCPVRNAAAIHAEPGSAHSMSSCREAAGLRAA